LDDALQEVGIENLRILTSGPLPPSPADTLTSQAMGVLLAKLTERFDVLIADSPPVLVASDAVAVAPRMDGVLFVVAAESTSRRVAKSALETLRRANGMILGTVLNMLPQSKQQNYYYYNYQSQASDINTGSLPSKPAISGQGSTVKDRMQAFVHDA
jgi:capsular exopolysaccharide synthesis family protein